MRYLLATILLVGSLASAAAGQARSGSNPPSTLAASQPIVPTATRARVLSRVVENSTATPLLPAWGNATLNTAAVETARPRTTTKSANAKPAVLPSALTNVYKVGVGDVLDVQLANSRSNKSTLFTVLEGGMLDFPLAGNPVPVAGLTVVEIAARLRQQIRIFENPAVIVNVRDFASHSVTVSGLVAVPGVKTLQREAVPLYVLMAQSMPLPEAGRATVLRAGRPPIEVNLREAGASSVLVVPGDSIRVSFQPAASPKFFFAGGALNAPGQKTFHAGLTLTQAILASGGLNSEAGSKVLVARTGTDGRLLTTEYSLRQIEDGKIPDPLLQEGDRLQVTKGR